MSNGSYSITTWIMSRQQWELIKLNWQCFHKKFDSFFCWINQLLQYLSYLKYSLLDRSLNCPPAAENPAKGSRFWKRYFEEMEISEIWTKGGDINETKMYTSGENSEKSNILLMFHIMVTTGTPDWGSCVPGLLDYWCAPGARPHLHVPGVARGRRSVLNAHSMGHPLKRGGT